MIKLLRSCPRERSEHVKIKEKATVNKDLWEEVHIALKIMMK